MREKSEAFLKGMIWVCTLTVISIVYSTISLAAVPREIGGLVIGGNIEEFKDKLNLDTAIPIRFREYLKEATVKKIDGFKSGVVWYGTVSSPGRIMRISLKYEDSSREFYDTLLKEFRNRFGRPSEWRGDSFGVFIAWKWSLADAQGKRVSMVLQHNIQDPDQKMGNVIKLTMWNLIDEEQRIFEQKYQDRSKSIGETKTETRAYTPEDIHQFIPR